LEKANAYANGNEKQVMQTSAKWKQIKASTQIFHELTKVKSQRLWKRD